MEFWPCARRRVAGTVRKMDAMNDLKGKYDDLWLAHLDVTDREREIPGGLEAATECGR